MSLKKQLDALRASDKTPTLAESKRAVRLCLRRPGLRLRLALAILAALSLTVGAVYVVESMFYAVPWRAVSERSPALYHALEALLYLSDAAVVLFLGVPVFHGACRVILSAATGVPLPLATLFDAFSCGRQYRRTLAVTLLCLLSASGAVGIVYGLLRLSLWTGQFSPVAAVLPALLCAGAICVLSVLLSGFFTILPLSCLAPETPVRVLFAASRSLTRGGLTSLWVLRLSLLPHVLLGVLTFGISLIFDGAAYASLTCTLWLGLTPPPAESQTLHSPARK